MPKEVFDTMYPKFSKEEEKAVIDFYLKYKKYFKNLPIQDIFSFGLLNYAAELYMEDKKDMDRVKFLLTKGYLINRMKISKLPKEIKDFFKN